MKRWNSYRLAEKISVIIMWGIVLATIIYTAVMYPDLPDTIPKHFGALGKPDSWGGKENILTGVIIQILIALLNQKALSSSVKESERTGFVDMSNRNCMMLLGPVVTASLAWITFATITWGRLGKYFLFVMIALVAVIIAFVVYTRKHYKENIDVEAERELKKTNERTTKIRQDDTSYPGDLKFKGKIAVWMWGILIFLQIVIFGTLLSVIREGINGQIGEFIVMLLIFAMLEVFLIPMYIRNYVLVTKDEIIIKVGLLGSRIPIQDVRLLQETTNPISSLAMSLDRIYIYTYSGRDVLISVVDKKEFIDEVYTRQEQESGQ